MKRRPSSIVSQLVRRRDFLGDDGGVAVELGLLASFFLVPLLLGIIQYGLYFNATQSLAAAPTERLAMVVPHEDFHAQIDGLPRRIEEAAATLVGFLAGAAALNEQALDAELFLKKSEIVNRYFDRLSAIYKSARGGALSETVARAEPQRLMGVLQQECSAIQPAPRSFNKCVSAANNAGLAFDHTYTKYYPLLYQVYEGCGKDLKCTAQKIMAAPRKRRERDLVAYFESLK